VNGKFIQIKNQQNTLSLRDIFNCLYLLGTGTMIPMHSAKNQGFTWPPITLHILDWQL